MKSIINDNDRRLVKHNDFNRENQIQDLNIDNFCKYLISDFSCFDASNAIKLLLDCLDNDFENRLKYSSFSNFLYRAKDIERDHAIMNIETMYKYLLKENELCEELENDKRDSLKKIVYKLWDHILLATNQYIQLKNKDEELDNNFRKNFTKEKDKISKKIEQSSHSLTNQLISIVGIFTAMAFLVLGGLDSLSSIFKNISNNISILKVSFICLLWGLFIFNTIYLFVYLVGRLIEKDNRKEDRYSSRIPTLLKVNIESEKLISKDILQKHLILFFGNAILLVVLTLIGWLYFIKNDFCCWYSYLHSVFGGFTPFIYPLILVICLCITVFLLKYKIKISKRKKN